MNHGYSHPGSSDQTLTMKSPTACSPIPHLLEINPFQKFEFSFPCEEMWWDDLDTTTSDYFSCDEDYSALSEVSDDEIFTAPGPAMIDTSFPSKFYSLSSNPIPEPDPDFNEKDVLIQKIISTISHVSPTSVYKRQRAAMKRRRHRRKRKQMRAALIEPELRSLWHNSSEGDLFALPTVTAPKPPPSLPTINLNSVNRTMLRKLPEVVNAPIHSCAEDERFYTKVVCQHYATKFTSTPKPLTQHQRENPFGSLPAIMTDVGPVPPPSEAAYGYVYSDGQWCVKAQPPVPDPGGGQRGRGEDGGRRAGGTESRGWRSRICER